MPFNPAQFGAVPVANSGTSTNFNASQFGAQPINQPQQEGAQLHDTGSFGGNLMNSAGNFFSGIGHAIAHPLNTISNLGNTALGEAEKLVPGRQGAENQADAFNNFYKERYGSFDNFITTLKQDPVGALADASAILGIGGGIAGGVGKLSGLETATKIGGALGTASDFTNPISLASKGVSAVGKVASSGLKDLQDSLTQSTLHMTPVQKTDFAKSMPEITKYLEDKVPAGDNFTQLEAVNNDYLSHESQIQQFLKDSTNETTGVSRSDLIDSVNAIKKDFRTSRDALAIDNQIDDFVKTLETKHSDTIPLTDLNALKRSTMENAFNGAGTKVSDDVEYALGDILKTKLEQATANMTLPEGKSLSDFNKEYSTIIKTRQLLKKASGRNQIGFAGKLAAKAVGGLVGEHTGGPIAAAVGAAMGDTVAEKVAGNAAHSYAAKVVGKAAKVIPKIKVGANAAKATNIMVRVNGAKK